MKIQKQKKLKAKTQDQTWEIKILKITFGEKKLEVKILEAKLNT